MLKRREECNTYLTHICRHRWSREGWPGPSQLLRFYCITGRDLGNFNLGFTQLHHLGLVDKLFCSKSLVSISTVLLAIANEELLGSKEENFRDQFRIMLPAGSLLVGQSVGTQYKRREGISCLVFTLEYSVTPYQIQQKENCLKVVSQLKQHVQ